MGDITNGIDVVVAFDLKILVDGDTTVLLELKARLFQESGSRSDTSAHDDEIGWNGVLALELQEAGLGGVGF